MLSVVIDALLIGLLGATCAYCISLNRRLAAIKSGQDALESAIAAFDEASRRAESTFRHAEQAGRHQHADLDAAVRRANALAAELSVMINAGDNIAGRIETAIGDVKSIGARKARGAVTELRKSA
ncbi:MAG: DUF6468 domain-containing protein [Pseudomonadota bacterium]